MATGPRYFVPFRRRREGKTDYYQRTRLVVADVPRMVVRKTNRHIIVQLVTAEMDGDRTLVAANSAELEKYGYKGSTSSTPAAYLTGMLFAVKAKKASRTVQSLISVSTGQHRGTCLCSTQRVLSKQVSRSRTVRRSSRRMSVPRVHISLHTTRMQGIS